MSMNDARFHGAASRTALLAAGLILMLGVPQAALSKDSGSDGSGSGHSGSDHSGSRGPDSGGHGSDDRSPDGSGSSSRSGKGSDGDDASDGRNDGSGDDGKNKDARERRHTYDGGWRAQILDGRYKVFDPAGRVVINRKARISDYKKF